jgi:hypothetical protein
MITCKLSGGLGNQMFEIAATAAYAVKHDIGLYIPKETFDGKTGYFGHSLENNGRGDHGPWGLAWKWQEPNDKTFLEIPAPPAGKDVVLDGDNAPYQSYKYFDQCKLVSDGSIFFPIIKIPTELHDAVAVHVRRGDYLEHADLHPFVGEKYLTSAITDMAKRGRKNFWIFSDDNDWCTDFFSDLVIDDMGDFYNCDFNIIQSVDAVATFNTMLKASHYIISNSSFSWWAAWLNPNPGKVIIAPQRWDGPALSHVNRKDLIPENWIRL